MISWEAWYNIAASTEPEQRLECLPITEEENFRPLPPGMHESRVFLITDNQSNKRTWKSWSRSVFIIKHHTTTQKRDVLTDNAETPPWGEHARAYIRVTLSTLVSAPVQWHAEVGHGKQSGKGWNSARKSLGHANQIVLKASGRPDPVRGRFSHSPAPSPVRCREESRTHQHHSRTLEEWRHQGKFPKTDFATSHRRDPHLKKQHRVSFDIGISGCAADGVKDRLNPMN